MCRRVTCKACGKPTWSGCGNHVEQALAGVPKADRCQGHSASSQEQAASSGSFLSRLFGR